MKQKFTVTGMTCKPHSAVGAAGTPRTLNLRGRNESVLAPRFCDPQNACARPRARALPRLAEQAIPEVMFR